MHRKYTLGLIAASLVVLLAPSLAFAEIPDWVKTSAGWWADGSVGDATFVDALEYLISQGVIVVDNCADLANTESPGDVSEIPDWVKTSAGWWADGSVGDATFVDALEYLISQGVIVVDNCADLANTESPSDTSETASSEPPVSIEWIKQHMVLGPSLVSIDEFIERHPYHLEILKSYIDTELTKQKEWAEYNNKEFVPAIVSASESDIYDYIRSKTYQKAGFEEKYPRSSISITMDNFDKPWTGDKPWEEDTRTNVIYTNVDEIRYNSLAYTMNRQYVDGYSHTYTKTDQCALGFCTYSTRNALYFHPGVSISIRGFDEFTTLPFTITDNNGKIVDPEDRLYSGQYTVEFDESIQKRVGSVSPYSYEPAVLTFTVVEHPLWLPSDKPEDSTPSELASRIKQVKQQLTWDDPWVPDHLDNERKLADAYEIVDEFIELHPYNLEILESYVGADLAEQRARVEGDGREWSSIVPDKVEWSGLIEYIRSNTYRDVEIPQDLDFIPTTFEIIYRDWIRCNNDEAAYIVDRYCLETSFQSSKYTLEQDPVVYAVNHQYHDSYRFATGYTPPGVYTLSMSLDLEPRISGANGVDIAHMDYYALSPVQYGDRHSDTLLYQRYALPPGQYTVDILNKRSGEKIDYSITLTVVELPMWRP